MKEDKKTLIYDLKEYKDKIIYIKFIGGREIIGKLVSYDSIPNLVLKNGNVPEYEWIFGNSVVCLGTSIASISLGHPKEVCK